MLMAPGPDVQKGDIQDCLVASVRLDSTNHPRCARRLLP